MKKGLKFKLFLLHTVTSFIFLLYVIANNYTTKSVNEINRLIGGGYVKVQREFGDISEEVQSNIKDLFMYQGKLIAALAQNSTEYNEAKEAFTETLANSISASQLTAMKKEAGAKRLNIAFYILLFGAICGSALVLLRSIISPIKSAQSQLSDITEEIDANNGDLTKRIEVNSKDEVGDLVSDVNRFIEQLQNIIKKIQMESGHMNESIETITN